MRTQIFIILQVCLVLAYANTFTTFSNATYQAQTAQQKMAQLWGEITSDQTPYGWYSLLRMGGIFLEKMKPSFDTYSDALPEGRKKYIHSVGCVAQAEFVAEEGSPYTGMFQGASNVLVRISTAKDPNPKIAPEENFVPGMGIKLLRDGVPSANLVAMFGVDGVDSWNIFRHDWSNHIPNPVGLPLKVLGKKFAEATPYIGRIGLKTWAQYDQNGTKVDDSTLKIPFTLVFRPTSETANLFPDTYSDSLTDQLKTIPAGTALYDVLAVEGPDAQQVKIGTLKTKSNFVTSRFGDKSLFFQHNYIEDDLELHPNWKQAMEANPSIMGKLMEEFHK